MNQTPTTADATDVQRMLGESVEAFTRRATDMSRVRALRDQLPGFDHDVWKEMAGLGWTGLLVPEECGGSQLGLRDMAVVAQGLATQLAPEPLASSSVLGVRTLVRCDNKHLAGALLSAISAGDLISAVAFQEDAGVLLSEPTRTRAAPAANRIALHGSKHFVVGAAGADGFIVSARTQAGDVLVWVPSDSDDLTVTQRPLADGRFAASIVLDGVSVPMENLLARGNSAPNAIARAVDETTVIVAAELLGLMGRTLEITLEYLRTRVQFGKPIGTFQTLQHRAVDLYIQQELASASLGDALRALEDRPDDAATQASISRAKARCSDAAALITRQAIQMHGAIGFTEDSDVGLFVKRALTLGAWLGNSAYHRRRFAQLMPSDANVNFE